MGRITGLGGAFLRAKSPKALYEWYEKHLGVQQEAYGSFVFPKETVTADTVLAFFPEDTDHFGPGGQPAMLNFRVEDLDGLLETLTAAGVEVDPKRDAYDFGKFGWIRDPEGNRIELWEPLAAAPSRDEPATAKG